MPIWDTPADEILRRVSRDEYRFLSAEKPAIYLAILVELYRAQQQRMQLELPFDSLLDAVAEQYQANEAEQSTAASRLRQDLNTLQTNGNVQQRIEPRRIRRIQDRGLDRVLVRLTDSTREILAHLETRLDQLLANRDTSARFSLFEVDDLLGDVLPLLVEDGVMDHDRACRAGRNLARAHKAVVEAGDDLLRLDLWLSKLAVDAPDYATLLDLVQRLEAYFDRYLREIEQRRQTCYEKLQQLMTDEAASMLGMIDAAMIREIDEDPTRQGAKARLAVETLATIHDFLEPGGILDDGRRTVHDRLADVAGHLKRHLAELVRRSQLLGRLRQLSSHLIHAEQAFFDGGQADAFMLDLWKSAHLVLDETAGTPEQQTTPQRPARSPGPRQRPAGALFTPRRSKRQGDARALLLRRLTQLNEFVHRAILRGQHESLVSDAVLEGPSDVQLLIAAVRFGRQQRSPLRRRYLNYQVSRVSEANVSLPTVDGVGHLHLPELIFRRDSST